MAKNGVNKAWNPFNTNCLNHPDIIRTKVTEEEQDNDQFNGDPGGGDDEDDQYPS